MEDIIYIIERRKRRRVSAVEETACVVSCIRNTEGYPWKVEGGYG